MQLQADQDLTMPYDVIAQPTAVIPRGTKAPVERTTVDVAPNLPCVNILLDQRTLANEVICSAAEIAHVRRVIAVIALGGGS
jgi:hypothetical protein